MIETREQLAATLFHGTGIELGVAGGYFSAQIVQHERVQRLYSIDRWSDHHGLAEYKAAVEKLAPMGRCVPLRMSFHEALPLFADGSLDFIYVDGYAHTGQEGGQTLRDWWVKLKPGGIMAGHDYHARWQPTIDAVDAFTRAQGVQISLTQKDRYPSWWCTRPALAYPPETPLVIEPGQSVCLVGNGPSVLRGDGAAIDAHDVVIRFNRYQLAGYEPHTGRKTTIWSTFGHGYLPGDADQRPQRILYVYGERGGPAYAPEMLHRIPRAFYNELLARVRALSVKQRDIGITSGCVVTAWLLEQCGVPCVSLAGFDHFSKQHSPQHHYYNPKPYGMPPELDGDAEARLFAQWHAAGRVRYLSTSVTARIHSPLPSFATPCPCAPGDHHDIRCTCPHA